MDSDDDMEMEPEEYEINFLAALRSKKVIIQNADETLRCPVCPSKKKQSYPYKDLLQHAAAIAVGNRAPEAVGKHSALKKYLESDLLSLATPPVERINRVQQEAPRRQETEELLVCPWSVVIYNIDNTKRDSQDKQIGLGRSELKDYFADFKPEKVHVFWGSRGHLGMGVLQFGQDFSGLKNAQALEKLFLDKEHGHREYERNWSCRRRGKDFYGWLARNEDFNGRPGYQGLEIGKYLRNYCNLRDIEMVDEERKKMHEQLVQKLTETVSEKNEESLSLRNEIANVRRKAEAERLQLEETHKQELDEVRSKARKSEEEYNQAILESNQALEDKEAELRKRDKELQEKESFSVADKTLLETQKKENREQQEMIAIQQDLQKQLLTDKMKLIQKHEEETKEMAEKVHKMTLKLANKQKKEIEKHQLQGILEAEKAIEKLKSKHSSANHVNEDNARESKKIVEELTKKLKDLEDEKEYAEDTMNSLLMKERASTDEITEAQELAAKAMIEFSKPLKRRSIEAAMTKKKEAIKEVAYPEVRIKWAGSIDESPWAPAFQKVHKDDSDWDVKMKIALSEWEDRIRNPAFRPFKRVDLGGDKWTDIIDPDNKELLSLKEEYGVEVHESVTTALKEIEDFNASGRYPIAVAWNFEKSKRATLKEVIAYMTAVIIALTPGKKKARV